jgi:hypothetical protein
MVDALLDLALDESKWMPAAMFVAAVLALAALARAARRGASGRARVLVALNVLFGGTIGVMAFGHLLAVAILHGRGALEGSPWILYPLGVLLIVPAVWLVAGADRVDAEAGTRLVALNGWLALGLIALGVTNLPLAVPAFLNVAYQMHRRPIAGRVILGVALAWYGALFAGAVAFLAHGGSFEEFRGMS